MTIGDGRFDFKFLPNSSSTNVRVGRYPFKYAKNHPFAQNKDGRRERRLIAHVGTRTARFFLVQYCTKKWKIFPKIIKRP
jgi:hypothetical protein